MDEQKKEQYRVIIAGSREFKDYNFLRDYCDWCLKNKLKTHEVIIVSGHARGADTLGEKYAAERNLKVQLFPADWEKYGKSAGKRRNIKMAEVANACIGFVIKGLECTGTEHMLSVARKKNLNVRRVEYEEVQTKES